MFVNLKINHVSVSFIGIIHLLIISKSIYGQVDTVNKMLPARAECCEGSLVISEFIFSPESRPTSGCHASTIEEIKEGFITAWFGGTREGHEDVGIWISRNTIR